MMAWCDFMDVKIFSDRHKMFHLVYIGMPHLGEKAEGWWGIWVVNWELDVSLDWQTEVDNQHDWDGEILSVTLGPGMWALAFYSIFIFNVNTLHHLLCTCCVLTTLKCEQMFWKCLESTLHTNICVTLIFASDNPTFSMLHNLHFSCRLCNTLVY